MTITKAQADRCPVGILWDPSAPGLGLRRQRPDGVRTWIFRFVAGGRKRQITIGRYPDVSPAEARAVASLRRAEVVRRDPVAELRARTVREVVAHFVEHHRSRRKAIAPKDDRNLRRYCAAMVDAWGGRRADEIRHTDVAELMASSTAGPYAANRLRAAVRLVWNCARRWQFVPGGMVNPAEAAPVNRERTRSVRALNPDEVRAFVGAAMQRHAEHGLDGAALVLLALTGARAGEVLSLRRDDVDLERRTLIFRDRKDGGDLVVPLGDVAIFVLRDVLAGHTSGWVFPSTRGGGHLVELRDARAWCLKRAGLPASTRTHDIRAAVATTIAGAVGLRAAQQVLGHADSRTTLRYTRPGDADRRAGVDALEAALSGSPPKIASR